MDVMLVVLRIIHILSGVFWAGMAFFIVSLLMPAVRATGPAGALIMRHLSAPRRLPAAVASSALLTVLSGAGLYWRNTSLSAGVWAQSRAGITYGVGAVTAVIALILAITLVGPTVQKLVELGRTIEFGGAPATPDQLGTVKRLQGRIAAGSRAAAGLLSVTVITMAVARYL
jgi:uncharacterized membrane protein